MDYPYEDEFMTYDLKTHRYILTKEDLYMNYNENLDKKFKDEKDIQPFLRNISNEIYNYIHSFNINPIRQDFIIAQTESGRQIIKEAMESQAIYELRVGNYRYSGDPEKQKNWLAPDAKDILDRELPEIGVPVTYAGRFPYVCFGVTKEW